MVGGIKLAWWKLAVIAFLALGSLAFEMPRLLFIGGYLAELGAPFVHDAAVVPAGTAAAHAGIRTGDRLDTGKLRRAEADRFRYQFNLYRVGSRIDVPLVRAQNPLTVAVTIERQRVPAYERFVWIVVTLWAVAVLGAGCAIVLAHPNIVTGAFFASTAGIVVSSSTPSYVRGIAGAVFEGVGSRFQQRRSAGWEGGAMSIGETEPLVAKVRTSKTVAYLDEVDLPASEGRGENRRPIIAVPVWRFERLDAILFVGRHRNGESPDPTEERIICELARAAGIAYARIDTAEHERTIAELRRNVTELERENNALGQLLHPSERPA